jgi:hypothetical protein
MRLSSLAVLCACAWAAAPAAAVLGVDAEPAAPSAPAFAAPAAAPGALALAAPALIPALTPSAALAPALSAAPAFSAAALPADAAPAFVAAAAPAPTVPGVLVAATQERPDAARSLRAAGAAATAAPESVGRLYDAAPAAPDFAALALTPPVAERAAWTPRAALLRPAAALANAFGAAAARRADARRGPEARPTSEELNARRGLGELHAALESGRVQDALELASKYFLGGYATRWYAEHPRYAPYRAQASEYMRFAEGAVLGAYRRAGLRGQDPALAAEARDAAASGPALGRAWRPTVLQDADVGHCALHALYNAIDASVGFAAPTKVADFIAAARAMLDRPARFDRPIDERRAAELAAEMGLSFGRRAVDDGMVPTDLTELAAGLGLGRTAEPAPRDADGWSALLVSDREILLSLRMFHPSYPHAPAEAAAAGHDYRVLHHEAYLLGAFDSPSLGERLFMVQDSGSGTTLLATAAELTALTQEVDAIRTGAAPVAAPRP